MLACELVHRFPRGKLSVILCGARSPFMLELHHDSSIVTSAKYFWLKPPTCLPTAVETARRAAGSSPFLSTSAAFLLRRERGCREPAGLVRPSCAHVISRKRRAERTKCAESAPNRQVNWNMCKRKRDWAFHL